MYLDSNKPKTTSELINEPDASRLIFGLRDTGYDVYTAAADIIDNSIAADASNINIDVQLHTDGRKFVYFGDDGHGMNHDELHNAMKYGAKKRENLASLGKFGLGLKTASSSVCLKYSIISRNISGASLYKLTWDLEHVAKEDTWVMLSDPITEDEEEMFENLCGEVGTLVVWGKCDRLLSKHYDEPGGTKEQAAINYRINKLKEHCALVFHKYLDHSETKYPNINITVNDTPVTHWNPFYPEKSEQVLHEDQTKLKIQLEDGSIESATVKAWILPHSKDMTSAENKEFAKLSNRGQGFYIHREGRLIHSGGWLGLWRADDPHYSLLRVEFDFDHKLDEAFHVDVKKSRILLDPGLEEGLKELLVGAYKEANNRYRRKQTAKVTGGIPHIDSNKTISQTPNTNKASVQSVDPNNDQAQVDNNRGKGIKILTPVKNNISPDKLYVNPVDNINNGYLWEPCLTSATDSNHATGVNINKNHDFYIKIYSQMRTAGSVEGLDLLIWALGAAEHQNTDDELDEIWEDIREEVSSNLRKLLRKVNIPLDNGSEEK